MNGGLSRPRITSIDWLRGLVMVLMLIDHMRDLILAETFWHRSSDLSVISSATFITRVITHLCAPLFMLLVGTSVALQIQAGKPMALVQRFLWTRGLWLVFLEFTLVHFGMAWSWNPLGHLGQAQVIWALGLSMLLLAVMVRLPWNWILMVSLVLVMGHNLLDPIVVTAWKGPGTPFPGVWGSLWMVLHQPGTITPFGGTAPMLNIQYPLIPWPGVMGLGFCMGRLYGMESELRREALLKLGMTSIGMFVCLRLWNAYGDASHWTHQATAFRTGLSFLNTTKYPPSLLFLLMTIGTGLLLLAYREGKTDNLLDRGLITFGRVPMFFYLLQWPMARAMSLLFHALAGKDWWFLITDKGEPSNLGFKLWAVYVGWAIGLVLLYPLCHWFSGVKGRRKEWWLSYL